MKEKAIIVSGYFNPLHKGHIEYFKLARQGADFLFVIVNNDNQRKLKESKEFMLEDERIIIINELKVVDKVILSIDQDRSVSKSIEMLYKDYGDMYDLSFANGGDQISNNIPEVEICKKLNIKLIDNLGEKIQSSSWILKSKN
jgi:cytidyltransferase-like protein